MSEGRPRWTILEVLDWTRGHFERKGLPSPRLDAEVLLAHVLKTERIMLYARFDQPLDPEELARMRHLVAERARRAPIAYLVGKREFWSLELEVGRDVLIPRPDSEILIEVAQRRCADPRRIVDVGTGSGALALALATIVKNAHVFGLEISSGAADVARRNVERLGLTERVHVLESDLLRGLPSSALPADLMVANLPYIRAAEIENLDPEVRAYEPHLALNGGPDGLSLIRPLVSAAPEVLGPGALLALESGPEQVETIVALMKEVGFQAVEVTKDMAGLERVTSGLWPSSVSPGERG